MCAVETIPQRTDRRAHPHDASVTGRSASSSMRKCRGRSSTKTTTSATSSAVIIPGSASGVRPRPVVEREVGRDAARADVRAADAVLAQLVVERAREADLAELRRAVDGLERQPAPAGLGGERDHVALAPEHVRQRGAHGVERALQVHVDHLVEVLLREVEERRRRRRRPRSRRRCRCRRSARRSRRRARVEPAAVAHVARLRDDAVEAEVVAAARGEPEVRRRAAWSMRATAAPMPRLAPVITAVLPSRLIVPPEVAVPDRARGSARSRAAYAVDPRGVGLDARRDAHAARDRLCRVGEHAGAHAREQRGAERGARVGRRALERQVEHGGDDPHPQVAARAAAREAADRRLARRARAAARASRAGRRRRPPSPRARARRGRGAARGPVNAPRASGSACGVRSPARYGANSRPSTPGLPALPPRASSSPNARAEHAAQPARATRPPRASRPSRARCPGTAWQKTCTRASRSGA